MLYEDVEETSGAASGLAWAGFWRWGGWWRSGSGIGSRDGPGWATI